MDFDLESPSSPADYKSGFFGLNFSNDNATQYERWIDPGEWFNRVVQRKNLDGSEPTHQELADALNQWRTGFSQTNRWRARLYHRAEILWTHITNNKVHIAYSSNIPTSKKAAIKNALDPNSLEYLGQTFADVIQKLDDRSETLAEKFWPGGNVFAPRQIDVVVTGWEGDFF